MTEVSTEVKSPAEIISGKIKAEFINLIPDDQWTAMVEKEINKFTARTGYSKNDPSEFEKMVKTEIEKAIREKLVEKIRAIPYVNDEKILEGMILKISESASKGFLEGLTRTLGQNVLNAMRSGLSNY